MDERMFESLPIRSELSAFVGHCCTRCTPNRVDWIQRPPDGWRYRTSRSIDYHSRPTAGSVEYMYYDNWRRKRVDHQTTHNGASTARVMPNDLPPGWIHDDLDIERPPRDTSPDDDSYTYGSAAPPHSTLNYYGIAPGWSASGATP